MKWLTGGIVANHCWKVNCAYCVLRTTEWSTAAPVDQQHADGCHKIIWRTRYEDFLTVYTIFRGKYVRMCVLVLFLVLVFNALAVLWRCPVENPHDLLYMLQRHEPAKQTFVRHMISSFFFLLKIPLRLDNGYIVVRGEKYTAPRVTWHPSRANSRCINNFTRIFTCMMHNRSCFNAFICKCLITMQWYKLQLHWAKENGKGRCKCCIYFCTC